MISKKMKGVMIIVAFVAAVYFVTKIKETSLAKDVKSCVGSSVEVAEDKDDEKEIKEDAKKSVVNTEKPEDNPAVEEQIAKNKKDDGPVELWSVHTIEGNADDLYFTKTAVMDNYGNVHSRAYVVTCANYKKPVTFYLNKQYKKLIIKNLALSDEDKDTHHNYNIEFEGDGRYIGTDKDLCFTCKSKPIDEVVFDVEGVEALTLTVSGDYDYYSSVWLLMDSIDLYKE